MAEGRPDDPGLESVRLAYDRLGDVLDAPGRRHEAEPLETASAAYAAAWRAALA